jgi:hypothetical protein
MILGSDFFFFGLFYRERFATPVAVIACTGVAIPDSIFRSNPL